MPLLVLSLADAKLPLMPSLATLSAVALWATLIGLVEELYGRGLLVTLLGGRRHAVVAVLGSAVLFAYLHMPAYAGARGVRDALILSTSSAAFSAILAIVRLRSGSIVGPIVFHAINDTQSILMDLQSKRPASSASMRPMAIGCIVAAIYWVLCRRGLKWESGSS